jgi:hypothetical protein
LEELFELFKEYCGKAENEKRDLWLEISPDGSGSLKEEVYCLGHWTEIVFEFTTIEQAKEKMKALGIK